MSESKLIEWSRPDSYWEVVGYHLPLAIFTGVILLAARLVPFERSPFVVCWFRRLTGYPCMTCGFTRSFRSMALCDSGEAFSNSPLGASLYVLFLATFIWNVLALIFGVRLRRGAYLKVPHERVKVVLCLLGVLLLTNWIYRLITGQV